MSAEDTSGDSWPHTTRLLPWILAFFIAVVWLTPFNDISLNANLPIEIRLDRMVLPFVVIVWLAGARGGRSVRAALRMTWIHVALAALLASAFLSVVTDAHYLNQTLEFELSFKTLPLLVSYASIFVIAASAVRRSEVRPVHDVHARPRRDRRRRDDHRVPHQAKHLLEPVAESSSPAASVSRPQPVGTGFDSLGRRVVLGPTETPLEALAMLSMALPIAVVRIIESRRWRPRIAYGLMTGLLVAAIFSTYRKSGFIAPVGRSC